MTDDVHQGLRSGDRRARGDRQEARGRRPRARAVARALRARRPAVALLPRAARGRRAPHRDPQRARRAEAGAGVARAADDPDRGRCPWPQAARRAFSRRPRPRGRGARTLPAEACRRVPAIVSEAMRYSVFAGGKRLRPVPDAGRRRDASRAALGRAGSCDLRAARRVRDRD